MVFPTCAPRNVLRLAEKNHDKTEVSKKRVTEKLQNISIHALNIEVDELYDREYLQDSDS